MSTRRLLAGEQDGTLTFQQGAPPGTFRTGEEPPLTWALGPGEAAADWTVSGAVRALPGERAAGGGASFSCDHTGMI